VTAASTPDDRLALVSRTWDLYNAPGPRRGARRGLRGRARIESPAVTVHEDLIGKQWPAVEYEVGREKIREYANAVGETNPVYHDPEAAREAGYRNVVAPPMFCVVYSSAAVAPALFDPEVGINFAMMVHGGQEFVWGPLVVAGDEITTTVSVKSIEQRAGNGFYVFESRSVNQNGETVCTGTWTNIVRGLG
jgi:acyl dehydratase